MAETWCARRLTLNLIIIITITRKVDIKFVYSYTKLPFSVFWIMFILQIQMQASKTNSQRVLIYPVVFYARALLLWWLRLRPASTGAHPAVLCYLLGSISGCTFCYSALLSAKHESSSSRRVNGNSQSPMGPCLTHHREDKSWLWLLQKKLSSHWSGAGLH